MIGFFIGVSLAIFGILGVAYGLPPDKVFLTKGLQDLLSIVVGPIAAGFGGAIAGSYVSHSLQRRREEIKEVADKTDIVNEAIIVLVTKMNDLLSICKYYFLAHESDPVRFASLPMLPTIPGVPEKVSTGLSRVLLSVGATDRLMDIRLAEMKYETCFQNFDIRNSTLKDYAGYSVDVSVETHELQLADFVNALGLLRMMRLYRHTEALVRTFDGAIDELRRALEHILIDCAESFRKAGIHVMDFPFDPKSELFKKLEPPVKAEQEMLDYLTSLIREKNSGPVATETE